MINIPLFLQSVLHASLTRKGRKAFSPRFRLLVIMAVGLPFVMISSLSINKTLHHNVAYAALGSAHMSRRLTDDPERLLALDGAAVQDLFHEPGLQRHEGLTDIWQYRTSACVLDLYLADNGAGRVVHYETRMRDKRADDMDDAAQRDCIADIFSTIPMNVASR